MVRRKRVGRGGGGGEGEEGIKRIRSNVPIISTLTGRDSVWSVMVEL